MFNFTSRNRATYLPYCLRYWGYSHQYDTSLIDMSRGGVFERQAPYDPVAAQEMRRNPSAGKRTNENTSSADVPEATPVQVIQPSGADDEKVEEELANKIAAVDLDDALETAAAVDELAQNEEVVSGGTRPDPHMSKGCMLVVADPFIRFRVGFPCVSLTSHVP
jgi:hypothetical protein